MSEEAHPSAGEATVAPDPAVATGEAPVPSPEPSFIVRFFKLFSDLLTPTNVAVVVGVIFVGVTGLLGGWKAVGEEPETLPTAASGDAVEAAPLTITPLEAYWLEDPSAFGLSANDSVTLVVRAHVSTSREVDDPTASTLAEAVSGHLGSGDLVPQSGLWSNSVRTTDGGVGGPTVLRAVDLQSSRTIQPGMPQDYFLVWQLPIDTDQSSELTLDFYSHTWRASALDGHMMWTDRTLVHHEALTVGQKGSVD